MTKPSPVARTVLYVAGPMTGLPDYNFAAFEHATRCLTAAGYSAINPGRHGVDPTLTWVDYVRRGLLELIGQADGVALLDGWQQSRGAQIEYDVACALAMAVHPVQHWVDLATADQSEEPTA